MVQITNDEPPAATVRLVDPFPVQASPSASLPVPLTDYIERPHVLRALRDLLSGVGVRLVMLIGPGGVGKTRLALRLATDLESTFSSGVTFVPLAAVADPALVPATIAQALGLRWGEDQETSRGLHARLQQEEMLLVLDNFEHAVPAAPVIAELLTDCPGLTVLTTSRAPLRLSGEHVFVVPPLSQADPEQMTVSEVLEAEAVRLFVARATAATSTFSLTEANAGEIADVCRYLEGIPLAIELAAARVPSLPPRALLDRLQPRLPLLRDGPRDAPERLRSMHSAIAWSYDLLSPTEQRLFRRLAVFAGGCTLAGAEAVGESAHLLDGLAALVAVSLLQAHETPHEEPRYLMVESIREFALEQLAASGEEEAVRAAHAAYYLELAERAWPHWHTPDEATWIATFKAEQDNVRVALTWLKQAGDVRRSVRLIGAFWPFWNCQEQRVEGLPWLQQALVWTAGARTPERVRILNGAASLNCSLIAAYDPAGTGWSAESLDLADEIGDAEGALHAVSNLAGDALGRRDFDLATCLTEAGLARIRALGSALPNIACLEADRRGFLGFIALEQHDDVRAEQLIADARRRKRELGYFSREGTDSILLAVLAYRRGDLALALARCQEGLPYAVAAGGLQTLQFLLDRVAIIAGEVAQADQAARLGGIVELLHEVLTTAPNPDEQPDRDRAANAARSRLGDAAFAAAWAEGRRMRLEDAVAVGLAMTPSEALLAAMTRRRLATRDMLLSEREREVLALIADGRTDQEIADALFLSRRTVNAHVGHILAKLDASTRREAVNRGKELGLLLSHDHQR